MTDTAAGSAPFLHAGTDVPVLMHAVLMALTPGLLIATWFFGIGVLVQTALCVVTAMGCEAVALRLRGATARSGWRDGSAFITAALIALSLPPYVAWWVAPIATAFAIGVVKHAYGGLGGNVFNPAMAGVALAILAFSAEFAHWPRFPPSPAEGLALIFAPAGADVDAVSGATLLAGSKAALQQMRMMSELANAEWHGWLGARHGEWLNVAFLCGGLWLLMRRMIGWRVPVAMLGAMTVCAALAHGADPDRFLGPTVQLLSGGTMLAAFFIGTDPVTSPSTRAGQWCFGAGIGIGVFVLRSFGAFPDGVAFAVLLMNAGVPWLERATAPRILGG